LLVKSQAGTFSANARLRENERDQVAKALGVDGQVSRDLDLHFAGRNPHRTAEAGRPTSGEQLLRIGAGAWGARNRKLNL
jgi:hypothetical protein